MIVILCDIFADLIPTYGAYAFNLIVQRSLSTYVGDTVSLGVQIEAAICAIIYWRMFRACQNNGVIANTTVDKFKSTGEDKPRAKGSKNVRTSNLNCMETHAQQNVNSNGSAIRQGHITELEPGKENRAKSAKNVSAQIGNLNSGHILTMPNAVL